MSPNTTPQAESHTTELEHIVEQEHNAEPKYTGSQTEIQNSSTSDICPVDWSNRQFHLNLFMKNFPTKEYADEIHDPVILAVNLSEDLALIRSRDKENVYYLYTGEDDILVRITYPTDIEDILRLLGSGSKNHEVKMKWTKIHHKEEVYDESE